jgi:hypothetical protein
MNSVPNLTTHMRGPGTCAQGAYSVLRSGKEDQTPKSTLLIDVCYSIPCILSVCPFLSCSTAAQALILGNLKTIRLQFYVVEVFLSVHLCVSLSWHVVNLPRFAALYGSRCVKAMN